MHLMAPLIMKMFFAKVRRICFENTSVLFLCDDTEKEIDKAHAKKNSAINDKITLKIVICSGGTGGHMFPACALLETIKQCGHHAHMITDTRGDAFCNGIEDKTVVDTIRFSKKDILDAATASFKVISKFFNLWKSDCPDIIIGFGGIFTIAPIMVAKFLGAKVVIYEQNSIVGKANKLLSKISNLKLSTFNIDQSWKLISSPVRKEFLASKHVPYSCDGIIKIVVIGGSQGASSFSRIVPGALSRINENQRGNIEIIQQVSTGNISELQQKYQRIGIPAKLVNFVHNIADEMSSAQLIICRSGASTLAELSAIGRPAILIPYPEAAENHQFYNAMYYKNKNSAWIVEENKNTEKNLSEIIFSILNNRELLKTTASNMMNKLIGDSSVTFVDFIEKLYLNTLD